MNGLYCRDWHQCHRCGCTFQDATLRALSLIDHVLKLTSDIYECRDIARCDTFRQHRADELARERQADQLAIASTAIKPRKARR